MDVSGGGLHFHSLGTFLLFLLLFLPGGRLCLSLLERLLYMLGSLVGLAFGIDGDLRAGSIVRNDFFGLGLVGISFEEVELVLLEVRAHVGIERLSLLVDKPGHIDRLTCFELRLLFGRDVASQHLLGDTQFFLLCLFLPFGGLSLSLSLLGRAETKFNRPLVGIELKVGIEMLSRLGGHTFHIDASAFREFFFLPVVQLHALDFIGDAYPIGTLSDDVVGQAVDAHEAAGRLIFAGEGQFHGTTEVARFFEGFLVLIGKGMPEELTLQLRLLADGMDNGNECSVSRGFQGKTGIGIEGNISDFDRDGNKRSLAVLKQVIKMLALFEALTAYAHLFELLPLYLVGVNALEGLFLLSCIIRRIDTGGIQHLLIGGDFRRFEHLGENPCAGNGTLEGDFEEVELCGVLELPHEVGEEVLQGIAVLVELQETLFMLGGGRNGFQSIFFICSGYGSEALGLLFLDQKDFLIFDFFVHITMYLMAPTAVHGQR